MVAGILQKQADFGFVGGDQVPDLVFVLFFNLLDIQSLPLAATFLDRFEGMLVRFLQLDEFTDLEEEFVEVAESILHEVDFIVEVLGKTRHLLSQ